MSRAPEYMPPADRARRAGSFAGVAQEYERGRPGYPGAAIDWLLGREPLEVLDLGAGTGKLSEAVLERGHRVTAVEPLAEMRAILEERLPRARVLAGTAERLPLEDRSVDAVVVGAAFHWFDQQLALLEIVRVLREPGVLGLLGNSFDVSVRWVAALRAILGPPALERPGHWPAPELLREYFTELGEASFPHQQRVEPVTLRDLACSRSSVAVLPPPERAELLARIDALWQQSPELHGAQHAMLPWIARVGRCRGLRAQEPAWQAHAVDAHTVRPLRGEVLRPGQSPEELVFPGDEQPDTLHLAVREGGRVVAIASVMRDACPQIPCAEAWRIRGMASAAHVRGRGVGSMLLALCESHAREHGGLLLWCNARVGARAFYERGGLHVHGDRFEIPPIGPHYLMYKDL